MRVAVRGLVLSVLGASVVVSSQALPVAADTTSDTVTGTLVETVADDFAGDDSVSGVGIDPDDADAAFVPLDGVAAETVRDLVGDRVRARGPVRRGALRVSPSDVTALDPSAEPAPAPTLDGDTAAATRAVRVVAISVYFSDASSTKPEATSTISSKLFSSTTSVKSYYSEVTDGTWSVSGQVAGPYPVTRGSGCRYADWGAQAEAKAKAAGVSIGSDDHVMVIWPRTSACGWAGLGQVPGTRTWINQTSPMEFVMAHELGHNFGLHHASTLSCRDASGSRVTLTDTGSCSASEYGDPYSTMGGGSYAAYRLHHAIHREDMKVLPSSVVTTTSDRRVTLSPLYSTGAVRAVRVPRDGSSSYVVEYRRPTGSFDTFGSSSEVATGVLVHIDRGGRQTMLLDATPETSSFSDAALPVGRTVVDPDSRVRITLESRTASQAVVRVTSRSAFRQRWMDAVARGRPAAADVTADLLFAATR